MSSGKQPQSIISVVSSFFYWIIHILVCIYLFITIVALPFYNKGDYGYIGSHKNNFFLQVCVNIGKILIPVLLLYIGVNIISLMKEKRGALKERFFSILGDLSFTDICALCYGGVVLLSFAGSDFRAHAFWGAKDWYMGLVTQVTFLASYFLVSRIWRKNIWFPLLILPVSAVVFLLGYLNRFGIYPIKMGNAVATFISTIGNINWYCGYLVSVLFGAIYLIWDISFRKEQLTEKKPDWKKLLLYFYAVLGFGTLVTHGSSSGILAFLGIMLTLFLLSAGNGERFHAFLKVLFLFAAACLFTFVIRSLFPEAMTYVETTNDILTFGIVPVALFAGTGILLGAGSLLNRKGIYPAFGMKVFSRIVAAAAGVVVVGFVLLLICNTLKPGSIGSLSQLSVFTFSPEWGSLRGVTWRAGVMCFGEQDLWGKLFGVGPDSMGIYISSAQSSNELKMLIQQYFHGKSLTNAHNEWLTVLINNGLLGAISFVLMILSAIVRFLRKGLREGNKICGACAFCLLAYSINNIVSFQQVLNTPIIFVIMGMGEAYYRKDSV